MPRRRHGTCGHHQFLTSRRKTPADGAAFDRIQLLPVVLGSACAIATLALVDKRLDFERGPVLGSRDFPTPNGPVIERASIGGLGRIGVGLVSDTGGRCPFHLGRVRPIAGSRSPTKRGAGL